MMCVTAALRHASKRASKHPEDSYEAVRASFLRYAREAGHHAVHLRLLRSREAHPERRTVGPSSRLFPRAHASNRSFGSTRAR